jgi:hypothetical protein
MCCLHELETKIGDIWKRKTETELTEFTLVDKNCKAKLLPDQLIMPVQDGQQVSIADNRDVEIDVKS